MEGQASSGIRASSSSPRVSTLLAHVHPSDCSPLPHLPVKQVSAGAPFSLLPSPFDSPRTPSPAEIPMEAPGLGTEQGPPDQPQDREPPLTFTCTVSWAPGTVVLQVRAARMRTWQWEKMRH